MQINYTQIAVVLVVVIGFLLAIVYLVPKQGGEKTISVTGTAKVTVPPDKAAVYVQIITRSKTSADEAKNQNANISDALQTVLLNIGIDKKDIETEGFSVYPEYDYLPDQGQVLKGYAATNSMKINVKNFDNVGKIVDASVDAGGLISYINYELSTEKLNEYKTSVLANASRDARSKAEAIANGLDKRLGNLVSVTTSEYNYVPYPIYRAEAASGIDVKQVATDLPPKNVDVTATVQVTYEIA